MTTLTLKKEFFVDKAMLIDDCDTDNFIHRNFIQIARFAEHIVIKNTGKDALSYLKQLENTQETPPDVIFLDINMPMVNGFDFLREFENLSSEIQKKSKVVILSSSDNPRDLHQVSENTLVKEYVYKPLTRTELERLKKSLSFYLKFEKS